MPEEAVPRIPDTEKSQRRRFDNLSTGLIVSLNGIDTLDSGFNQTHIEVVVATGSQLAARKIMAAQAGRRRAAKHLTLVDRSLLHVVHAEANGHSFSIGAIHIYIVSTRYSRKCKATD